MLLEINHPPSATANREHLQMGAADLTEPTGAATRDTFEAFLADVEGGVQDAGQALLFSGNHLRLKVMLLRHRRNPRVIWGLKSHEDWAFKATLLRFARGAEPVHLLLTTEEDGGRQLQGWVVKRTMDSFWASPLEPRQAEAFLASRVDPGPFEKPRSA